MLERVERARAFADLALHAALARSDLGPADRALATDLVYGTLRWRGRLDYLLGRILDRELEKLEPVVASALRMGAYQIVLSPSTPDAAAVDQAVRCIRVAGASRAAGLVNAVLRRLALGWRNFALPALETDPQGHLSHALSLPAWLAERWLAEHGPEEAAALARALMQVPPRTVRANPLRTTPEALLAELRERYPDAVRGRYAPGALVLGRRGNPGVDPAFLAGRCTIQDEAAQLVTELLGPEPGENVLDTCAAPGAKSSAMAERMRDTGSVLALDIHGRRLGLLRRDARRLGLTSIRTLERDASQPLDDLAPGPGFDRVLVDAPCSGLGALRRNPDLRWRLRPGDPARLAQIQRELLRSAAAVVRPGGILVYSTCTLLPEENEGLVRDFLSSNTDFRPTPPTRLPAAVQPVRDEQGFLRCLPQHHDTDGFFAVRLERLA